MSDGSFLELREVAAHWSVPAGWSRLLGTRADVTIAGRNLATWTRYRGIDPEVSYLPPGILPRQEFATVPIPRTLVMRLDLAARD